MTPSQKQIYDLLDIYGPLPDHALVPLAQHLGNTHMSSSGVRSRRAELVDQDRVVAVGTMITPSGRTANLWATQ